MVVIQATDRMSSFTTILSLLAVLRFRTYFVAFKMSFLECKPAKNNFWMIWFFRAIFTCLSF